MYRDSNRKVFLIIAVFYIFLMIPVFMYALSLREEKAAVIEKDFTITAYCPGKCCNGHWAYMTSTGKSIGYYVGLGINIAATDPSVIPTGTDFVYRGKKYRAVDVGGAIKGRRIDLLFFTHAETEEFGIKRGQSVEIVSGQ